MRAADANFLRALEAFQRASIFASAIDVRSEDNKGQAGPAWLADERSCTVHVLGGAAILVFTVSSLGTPGREAQSWEGMLKILFSVIDIFPKALTTREWQGGLGCVLEGYCKSITQ